MIIINIPATPVKPAPSSSSPLGISSSPIFQSPDLPTTSTMGTKRVPIDLDITDGDTDSSECNKAIIMALHVFYICMYFWMVPMPGPLSFSVLHLKVESRLGV